MFRNVAILMLTISSVCSAQINVLSYHNDAFHSGQNLAETALTPANVNLATFGLLFTLPGDGSVDGQPLYVSGLNMPGRGPTNVLFAATEHDSVYAFDADHGGAPLWQVSLLPAGETPSDDHGCGQVSPEIGVTSTPVIDLNAGTHGTIYLVAMSKTPDFTYHQRLHALDITTGAEEFGGPVEITASFPGTGSGSVGGMVLFDPGLYKERAGLVLSNGVIYTSYASHCDAGPYTGWLIGYDQFSLAQRLVYNFTPNGGEGSIWGAGAGPAVDPAGNLFFQLANGTFDTNLDAMGFPSSQDYGNAFVELSVVGTPMVLDYWTMSNTVDESNNDIDLGSGGVMLLPDVTDGDGNVRHLGVGAGKDRNVYVFDRDNMGKFVPAGDTTIYQELLGRLRGPSFAAPAWFNGTVYFGAVNDSIRAFPVVDGLLTTSGMTSPSTFTYPGTTPAISANGTSNAILWAIENNDPLVLHAYDATNLSVELYNSFQDPNWPSSGAAVKWVPPTIVAGKVFVPTQSGIAVFGLFSSDFEKSEPGDTRRHHKQIPN